MVGAMQTARVVLETRANDSLQGRSQAFAISEVSNPNTVETNHKVYRRFWAFVTKSDSRRNASSKIHLMTSSQRASQQDEVDAGGCRRKRTKRET